MLVVKTTTRVGVIPHDDTMPGLVMASQMSFRGDFSCLTAQQL